MICVAWPLLLAAILPLWARQRGYSTMAAVEAERWKSVPAYLAFVPFVYLFISFIFYVVYCLHVSQLHSVLI